MKKKFIILIVFSLVSILIIIFLVNSSNKKNDLEKPYKTPFPTSNNNNGVSDSVSFNNALSNIDKEYPWYSSLPLDTDEYHVVYDFTEKKFRIRIKINVSFEDFQKIVQKAILDIESIGVKKPVSYYVFDYSGKRI